MIELHMPVAKVSCLGKQSLSRILRRAIPTRQIGCIHSLVAYTLNHHGHKLFLSVSFAEYIIMYIVCIDVYYNLFAICMPILAADITPQQNP